MALEGTLQDMSLSDLFQIFRLGHKTGVLVLVKAAERGIIHVAEGRVIDALLANGAEHTVKHTQEEAVIQMLLWDDASFVFRHDPNVCTRRKQIVQDAEWLVMEGMRRRNDPAHAIPYNLITLETKLQLSQLPSSAENGVSLDVNQWRILSQVSSSPNLRTICEATGIAPEQVIRTVAELMAIGLVEVVVPSPRPRPCAPATDHGWPADLTTQLPSNLASAAVGLSTHDERPPVGRGLLDAIMRRIRAL